MSKSRSGHTGSHAGQTREAGKASAVPETKSSKETKPASRPSSAVTSWIRAQLSHGDLRESTRSGQKSLDKSRESVIVVDGKKSPPSGSSVSAAAVSHKRPATQQWAWEHAKDVAIRRRPSGKLRDASTETVGKKKISLRSKGSTIQEQAEPWDGEKGSTKRRAVVTQEQGPTPGSEKKKAVIIERKEEGAYSQEAGRTADPLSSASNPAIVHTAAGKCTRAETEGPPENTREAPLPSLEENKTIESKGEDDTLAKAATKAADGASRPPPGSATRESPRPSRFPSSGSLTSPKPKPKHARPGARSSATSSAPSPRPPPEKDKAKDKEKGPSVKTSKAAASSKSNASSTAAIATTSATTNSSSASSLAGKSSLNASGAAAKKAKEQGETESLPTLKACMKSLAGAELASGSPARPRPDTPGEASPAAPDPEPKPPSTPPLSDTSSVRSPLVRFGKYTIHRLEVPPGRRLLPIGTKYKTRSRSPYLAPRDPKRAKEAVATPLRSPQQLKRHKKNQKAMARYWQRTEEEEAAWRVEMERRAEEEAERYRAEPPGSPGVPEPGEVEQGVAVAVGG